MFRRHVSSKWAPVFLSSVVIYAFVFSITSQTLSCDVDPRLPLSILLMFFLTRRDTTGGRVTVFHWSICLYAHTLNWETCVICCRQTGGRHGESDQDQREWPVGGWVQRQARPFPLHPRSTVGTSASGWRELRKCVCAPSTPLASLLQRCGRPTLKRKRFIQAHGIQTSETNRTALRTLPVPSRLGWSHIMSFKSSQGQTDMGSCCWLRLPAQLQPLKKKEMKCNIPFDLGTWQHFVVNYLSEFTRKWQLSTRLWGWFVWLQPTLPHPPFLYFFPSLESC